MRLTQSLTFSCNVGDYTPVYTEFFLNYLFCLLLNSLAFTKPLAWGYVLV